MSKQRAKGTALETAAARDLATVFPTARRRALEGANDKGDLEGVYIGGHEIVIECKNYRSYQIAEWVAELEREMSNANTPYGAVLFKRKGKSLENIDSQLVLMPYGIFKRILEHIKELEA